eukprot:11926399-Alexandrium_andersonii.AAC.1
MREGRRGFASRARGGWTFQQASVFRLHPGVAQTPPPPPNSAPNTPHTTALPLGCWRHRLPLPLPSNRTAVRDQWRTLSKPRACSVRGLFQARRA